MIVVRTHTRLSVVRHSHHDTESLDLSPYVIGFEWSKTIKDPGLLKLTLKPVLNWFNALFPDDIVNVYADLDDGNGFVRICLCYIDSIEVQGKVSESGNTITTFVVTCSDFQKSIIKTDFYTNPSLRNRQDLVLDSDFTQSQVGGLALVSQGITMFGTPADVVETFLVGLLGWGSQWRVPTSYPVNPLVEANRRAQLRQRAFGRLTPESRRQLAFITNAGALEEPSTRQRVIEALEQVRRELAAMPTSQRDQAARLEALKKQDVALKLRAFDNLLAKTQEGAPRTILDVMELGFIERKATDGFIGNTGIPTETGQLGALIEAYSNGMLNETCFDLRPVAWSGHPRTGNASYSRAPDELGINFEGTPLMPCAHNGVQYVPSVVFREHPYSTVEGIDFRTQGVMKNSVPLGYVPFGPIFSVPAEGKSRVFYDYRLNSAASNSDFAFLSPGAFKDPFNEPPIKHLDVVEIGPSDVSAFELRRTDAEIVNLTTVTDVSPIGFNRRQEARDLLPIAVPLSIARHGLRLRKNPTIYTSYGAGGLPAGVDNEHTRRIYARWGMLLDHWYQHNAEYLSGTINLRFRPDIRVGYRLDWQERHESYYVKGVVHTGQLIDGTWRILTHLSVNRGQRNDPFPAYIPPHYKPQIITPTMLAGDPSHEETPQMKKARLLAVASRTLPPGATAAGGYRGDGEQARLETYYTVVPDFHGVSIPSKMTEINYVDDQAGARFRGQVIGASSVSHDPEETERRLDGQSQADVRARLKEGEAQADAAADGMSLPAVTVQSEPSALPTIIITP